MGSGALMLWKRTKLVRGWENLNLDILLLIFKKLDHKRLLKTAYSVCRSWRSACYQKLFWKEPETIYFVTLKDVCVPSESYSGSKLMKLLENILDALQDKFEAARSILFPARLCLSDAHLSYIAQRLPKLRDICLPYNTNTITGAGFSRAIIYWSEMRILHIGALSFSEHIIQELSKNCKNLENLCIYTMDMNVHKKELNTFGLDEHISLVMANNLSRLKTLVLDFCVVYQSGLNNILSKCEGIEVILSRCTIGIRRGGNRITARRGGFYSFSIKKIAEEDNKMNWSIMHENAMENFESLMLMLHYIWEFAENLNTPTTEGMRTLKKRNQEAIQSLAADYHSCYL